MDVHLYKLTKEVWIVSNQSEEHNQLVATQDDTQPMSRNDVTLALAFFVALFATLGALFIGEVMGQMPCVLCWYQRVAMFPLAFILGVAAYRNDTSAIVYALPLSLVGFCYRCLALRPLYWSDSRTNRALHREWSRPAHQAK